MIDMLSRIFAPTLRRLLATAITSAVLLLNQKLGLNLDPMVISGVVITVTVYVLQSAWRQGKGMQVGDLPKLIQEGIEKALADKLPAKG